MSDSEKAFLEPARKRRSRSLVAIAEMSFQPTEKVLRARGEVAKVLRCGISDSVRHQNEASDHGGESNHAQHQCSGHEEEPQENEPHHEQQDATFDLVAVPGRRRLPFPRGRFVSQELALHLLKDLLLSLGKWHDSSLLSEGA